MSGKIYTIWGGKYSGKTTFTANLACALSERNLLVGLISSNLTYGELQILFGQAVPQEKGLFSALDKDSFNIGEKFIECGENKNLFLLSVPTCYSGLLCDTVTLQGVEDLLNAAALVFDILLIDGASEVNNPVSGVGLWLADKTFTLHRPSIAAQMWLKSVSDFSRELHIDEKQTHILMAPNGEFDDKAYRSMTELTFSYELPYVKRAGEIQNAGTPLYQFKDRTCRRYSKLLDEIADSICGGEKHEQ